MGGNGYIQKLNEKKNDRRHGMNKLGSESHYICKVLKHARDFKSKYSVVMEIF